MARVQNGIEKLPKISTSWARRTNVTHDRRQTDLLLYYPNVTHTRSQDFVWECTFFLKKLTTFFSRQSNPKSSWHSKKCPKIDFCSDWGCICCAGGALTNFPCELRPIFFLRPGGAPCRCTHCWLRLWRNVL